MCSSDLEIYRTNTIIQDDFLLRYCISNADNRQLINDLVSTRKQKPEAVNLLLGEIPIADLPSGNYNLNVEVRNRENKLLAYRQLFIQRMNPKEKQVVQDEYRMMDINNSFVSLMNDADSLKEFIACLAPISTQLELQTEDNLMALGELQSKIGRAHV